MGQGTATMKLPQLFQPPGSVVWDPSFESGINGCCLQLEISADRSRCEYRTRQSREAFWEPVIAALV